MIIKQYPQVKGDMDAWQFVKKSKDPSLYTIVPWDYAALLGLIFAFLWVFFNHMFNNPYLDGAA